MKTTCLFTALLIGAELLSGGQNHDRGMTHPVIANTHDK
jgi:hypothetical protein